jgi:hypothetical protein
LKLFPYDFELRPLEEEKKGKKKIFSPFYCLHCAYTETG